MRRSHAIFTLAISAALLTATSSAFAQGISQLQQLTSTTSPTSAITQTVYGKPFKITGLSTGQCLTLDANSLLTVTPCGSGASFGQGWEINAAGYLAPTTTIAALLPSGFVSQASSTIGSGTQTGGLTIRGGATTTGNHYFTGNIGIGPTTPTSRIGVTHTTNSLVPLLTATGFDNDNAWTPIGLFNESGTPSFVLYMPGVLNSTGNIGLGTSTPQSRLTVDHNSTVGTVTNGILINDSDTGTTWSTTAPGVVLDFGSNDTTGVGYGTRIRLGSVMEAASGASSRLGIFTAPTTAGTMVERLSVLSGGNVGIGATSPLGKFEVATDGATNDVFSTAYGTGVIPRFVMYGPRGVQGATTPNQTGDIIGQLSFQGRDSARTEGATISAVASATWGDDSSDAPTNIVFATAADGVETVTERMIVTSSGNVGIGSTTPAAALSIAQPSAAVPGFLLQGFANNTRPVFQVLGGNSPNTDLVSVASNANSSYFVVNSVGSVGFGSSTPYGRFSITNTTAAPSFIVEDSASPDSTPFIIDASGNVGIGTTTPWAKLSVEGTSSLGNQAVAGYFTATSTATASSFQAASTTQLSASSALYIPSSSSQTPTAGGQLALDTTDNQLKVGTGASTAVFDPRRPLSFNLSTTTAWTGTTTQNQLLAPFAGTLNTIQCKTDAGTLNVQVKINSTSLAMFNASTTTGVVTFTTSNTFSAGDIITAEFGTPASSPTTQRCTGFATQSGT